MNDKTDTEDLLLEQIIIRKYVREDGTEIVSLEGLDALGEALGLVDAMSLLEYAKLQLTIEMVRQSLYSDEDEEDYEEEC